VAVVPADQQASEQGLFLGCHDVERRKIANSAKEVQQPDMKGFGAHRLEISAKPAAVNMPDHKRNQLLS